MYDGSLRIAFDPWEMTLEHPVDLVFVTHGHYDHCDPDTVSRVVKDDATVIAADDCAHAFPGNVRSLKPGGVLRIGSVLVTATDAYTVGNAYHPRGAGVGYVVAVDHGTIFHAGDTDDIPETHGLKPDIALLPVGGTYTMDVAEASRAATAIGAAMTIPMHYGFIVGAKEDGEQFVIAAKVPTRALAPREAFRT